MTPRRRSVLIGVGFGILVAVGIAALLMFTPLGLVVYLLVMQNSGPFHRAEMEAIVGKVRAMDLKPGQEYRFRMKDLNDPDSLRKEPPNRMVHMGEGVGKVWAEVDGAGNLKVVIQTRDLGHAGEYGFAYSDTPLIPKDFGAPWYTVDVPSHINIVTLDMKIDDHWWEVVNNLD